MKLLAYIYHIYSNKLMDNYKIESHFSSKNYENFLQGSTSEKGGRRGKNNNEKRKRKEKSHKPEKYGSKLNFKPMVETPKEMTKAYSELTENLKDVEREMQAIYDYCEYMDDLIISHQNYKRTRCDEEDERRRQDAEEYER